MVIEAENAAPPAARTLEQLSSSEDFRVEMLNRGLGAKGAQSPTPVSEAHLGETLLPVPGHFFFTCSFFFSDRMTEAPWIDTLLRQRQFFVLFT